MQNGKGRHYGIPFAWHVARGRMVDAADVDNGKACGCVCVVCGAGLLARQGQVRAWHFAHEADNNCQYASEAAIHLMAKQLIAERQQICLPARVLGRQIRGVYGGWVETIAVTVQSAGLQALTSCQAEKTLYANRPQDGIRRPDVLAYLDGQPIAIEIHNTHAVDKDKRTWLAQQGYSVLEIDVADLTEMPVEGLMTSLLNRLFGPTPLSRWLCHRGDEEARQQLALLEQDVRARRQAEEHFLQEENVARENLARKKQAARERYRDVQESKIRLDGGTLRIAYNCYRVSMKLHGFIPEPVLNRIGRIARQQGGIFNGKAKCWEFQPHNLEVFYQHLHALVLADLQGGALPIMSFPVVTTAYADAHEQINQHDRHEALAERAAIIEFDAGFDRVQAEKLAGLAGLDRT